MRASAAQRGCRSVSVRWRMVAQPGPDHGPSTAFRAEHEEGLMADEYTGEFYCVKCKAKREATGEIKVNEKGTRMAKGKCPVCGTNLNRILGKA
jgi:hypothetical protein